MSKSKSHYDRLSVGQFVLVSCPSWSSWPDVTFIWVTITFFILHVERPLWREDGSVICSALTQVQFQVTLRQTVCRPVRLGVLPLLEQVTRCYIYLSDNYFLYSSCRAPSLTRGRSVICSAMMQVQCQVTLRPTVCRPVRLGVLPLLEQVTRCYIYLSDTYFLYSSCRAPSLTRGRICNLQCKDASSVSSYNATDCLSASSSWCRAPFLISLFDSYYVFSV
jgi:hypothetical protein